MSARRERARAKSTPRSKDVAPGGAERPIRKNHYLYQSKIDLARRILGVRSETEALDGALDLLTYGEALATGTEAMEREQYHDLLGVADEEHG
jgi:hypothetical protein